MQAERVLGDTIGRHVDVNRVLALAAEAGPAVPGDPPSGPAEPAAASRITIGYVTDSAFSFYYPENLEALTDRGATLEPISSLDRVELPDTLDALYIGGGFPETHAEALAANEPLRRSLRRAAVSGLPIYAECGGLMLLARSVTWDRRRHEMAGVLAVDVTVHPKVQGHGYAVLRVDRPNPFFAEGVTITGHEFHYSSCAEGAVGDTACAVLRGVGSGDGRDALVAWNTWASYTHVHALGCPEWADGLAAAARRHSLQRRPAASRSE
jgi:cobyrinic acid a,c-diamide synthase